MPQQGTPAFNPTGSPSPIDSNVMSYGATTVATTVSSGNTLAITAASGFSNLDFIILDESTANAELVQITAGGGTTSLTVYPAIQKTHTASTSTVALKGGRQIVSLGDPATPANQAKVDALGNLTTSGQDTVTTGSLGALSAVVSCVVTSGQSTWALEISGTWSGTIIFEEALDGVNYVQAYGRPSAYGVTAPGLPTSYVTDTGSGTARIFRGTCGGAQSFRAVMVAYTSGTATATLVTSAGESTSFPAGPMQLADALISTQIAVIDASGYQSENMRPVVTPATAGTVTTSTSTVSATVGQNSAALITIRGTYAGVVFVIEGSDDNTNWYPVAFVPMNSTSSGGVITSYTAASNALQAFFVLCQGFASIRLRATAYTSGTMNVHITPTVLPSAPVVNAVISNSPNVGTLTTVTNPVIIEPVKSSFVYVATGIAPVIGDTVQITAGSTKNARLHRIVISGVATAATVLDLLVTLRSAASTGGTSSAPAATPLDTGVTGPVSTLKLFTVVASSPGALTGSIYAGKLFLGTSATQPFLLDIVFANAVGCERPTLVKNTANTFGLNFSAAPAGASVDVAMYWTEE